MKKALGGLLAAALFFGSGVAAAGTCVGRPTDPAGYAGYTYGTDTVSMFDGTRVRIHYTVTGTNAVEPATTRTDMVPDSVALAAQIGDTALGQYSTMGFTTPPDDASCASNGGDGKTDIYLVRFAGADGSTVPDNCNGRSCASFVLCESTFSGRGYPTKADGFRTVVAHELFHTIQNAYDQGLDRFWAEGTAQWAMKTVYPDLTDFENQLPDYFKDNTRSIDSQPSGVTSGFLYGSAVWPLFLTLHEGPTTVRSVFEKETDGTGSIAAVDAVLQENGSSLAETYPVFGAWNTATKTLAGAAGYPDAAKYPGVAMLALADGETAITSGLPYYVYRGTLDSLSAVTLDTDETRNAAVLVPIENGKAAVDKVQKLPANAQGDVLVIVAGITTKKTDAPFTLHIGAPTAEPDAGADGGSSGASASGGTTDDSGCTVTPSSSSSGASSVLATLGLALAGLLAVRARRR